MENRINLISISGRIGSGKDTVAKMLQYKLGYCKRNPNNTRSFDDWLDKCGTDGEWQIKKFAGKLKQIASILTGIPVDKFEDQEFKKSLLGEEWGRSPLIFNGLGKAPKEETVMMSIREFLQKLGTDGLRDNLHENVWVNALFADRVPTKIQRDYDTDWKMRYPESELRLKSEYREYPKWIISDTRFENELQAVKDRGGLTIRLTRNSDVESSHISETALDDAEFDYVIDNKGKSLEETFSDVVRMIEKFNIV